MLKEKYLGAAVILLEELFNSLDSSDKLRLKQLIVNVSNDKLREYENEIKDDILYYMKAKPKYRSEHRLWNDPANQDYRLKLIYFCYKYLQRGYYLMDRILKVPKRNGYREVVTVFSMLTNHICSKKFPDTILDGQLTFEEFK